MFIGPKAQTFSEDAIVGYGKVDGLPRNEIDDSGMTLKKPLADITAVGSRTVRLGNMIDHPELFSAYPGLKRTKVRITSRDDGDVSNSLNRDSGDIHMKLVPGMTEREILRHAAHEIQHGVQQVEGFIGGGGHLDNVDTALGKTAGRLQKRAGQTGNKVYTEKALELSLAAGLLNEGEGNRAKEGIAVAAAQLARRSERLYRKIPGEVEAYTTDGRVNMDALQRTAAPTPHLQDKPPAAPQGREYSTHEAGVLRKYARRQKMVMLGEALTGVFNTLFNRVEASPAAPKASRAGTPKP